MTPTPHTAWRLALGLAFAAALPVQADDTTLTGDWGGLRRELDAQGVRFTGDYSGETAYNAHGGQHRSARYSQNVKLGVQFDLGKLYGFTNGDRIQLTINDRRGNSASEDLVGNRLPVSRFYCFAWAVSWIPPL